MISTAPSSQSSHPYALTLEYTHTIQHPPLQLHTPIVVQELPPPENISFSSPG